MVDGVAGQVTGLPFSTYRAKEQGRTYYDQVNRMSNMTEPTTNCCAFDPLKLNPREVSKSIEQQ